MKRIKSNNGFTLIELLVVIAIIGILASVVLASLNSARDKGSDAAAKTQLNSVRSQASIYYEDNGATYTGYCADAKSIEAMTGAVNAISPTVTVGGLGDSECAESLDGTQWAAWVNLKQDPTEAFCVDSAGAASVIGVQDSSAVDLVVCP